MSLKANCIYNMDALEFLRAMQDKSVDCVVTSPPYNIQRPKGKGSGIFADYTTDFLFSEGYQSYQDEMPEDEYQEWLRNVVLECLRISKGLVWFNHKMRFRDGEGIHPLRFLPFPVWSEVIWNRRGSMVLNARKFAPSHEYLFGFGRPHYWDNANNTLLTVWDITRGRSNHDNDHPCPFPEALIRPLIESSCPIDGVVCDPFLGSGTTARVAKMLDRQYIGCDISPEYCEVARQRVSQPFTMQMFKGEQ